MNDENIDIKLLQDTFSQLEKNADAMQREKDAERIEKMYQLVKNTFDKSYCQKVYNIVNAEYKVVPERTREMLEGRISIHFNQQLEKGTIEQILNIIVFGYPEVSEEKDFLAKQAKGYSGLADSTTKSDEVENASGKFGYDASNPIPVNGIDMIDDYFARLRLITGESITYHRLGSMQAENLEFPVDQYEIFNSENTSIAIVYVYAYYGNMTNKAPEGFKLTEK